MAGSEPLNPLEIMEDDAENIGRPLKIQEVTQEKPKFYRGVIFGQLLAFLVALSALCTKVLTDVFLVSSPALQMTCGYGVTALLFLYPCGGLAALKSGYDRRTIFMLLLIAVADSQAGFFGNLAYGFGVSIASVGMLSSFTIPCVMVLSCCFLKVRYGAKHYIGTAIALLGLVFVVLADAMAEDKPGPDDNKNSTGISNTTKTDDSTASLNNYVIGDLLIILGSVFYAVSNVATEAFVKQGNLYTYLCWLGIFGCAISLVQFAALEASNALSGAKYPEVLWLMFIGYALSFTSIYYGCARFLAVFDAVLFNLSLLTTDVWGLLIGYFIFDEEIHPIKFLGFVSVVIGVTLYNLEQPSHVGDDKNDTMNDILDDFGRIPDDDAHEIVVPT